VSKASVDSEIETADNTFRLFVLNNLVENMRVLFEDFALKESNLDVKEKTKSLLKILNTSF
jgi:hypothetical protein